MHPTHPIDPLVVWQLADSGFPTGGFAHSGGLEAAWQGGEVTTPDELRWFVQDALWQAGWGLLPLASTAYVEPRRLSELDERCQAFLTNAVANRASTVQGRALLATCARIWPGPAMTTLERSARSLHGHHAPIFGAALAVLDVPLETAQQVLLYAAARGLISAAVRLGILGPYAAQRLLFECHGDVAAVLMRCRTLRETDMAQTAPILELLQSGHDRLYSRLFQS